MKRMSFSGRVQLSFLLGNLAFIAFLVSLAFMRSWRTFQLEMLALIWGNLILSAAIGYICTANFRMARRKGNRKQFWQVWAVAFVMCVAATYMILQVTS